MKTDHLIGMLAAGVPAVDRHGVQRRYALALGVGIVAATALLLAVIGGVRADIAQAVRLPMFWVKFAFPLTLMIAALAAVNRLGRPGMKLGWSAAGLLLPVIAIWVLGAFSLTNAAPGEYERLIYGTSWKVCSVFVALVSAPVFVAALWAMKGLAPTRLPAAGAVSGFLAGAAGALVYSFYCPEMGAPFIGIWYLLGMLIPALVGFMLGPKLLRW